MKQRVRDRRRLPFFQVTKVDLTALSRACDDTKVRLSSARSVYFALLEVTNDERSDTAEVTRKELAERSGVSTRSLYDVTRVLETAGLLEVETDHGQANTWVLISAENRGGDPGNDCHPPLAMVATPPGNGCHTPYIESQEGEKDPPSPPLGVGVCQTCGSTCEIDGRCPSDVCQVFRHWRVVMDHPKALLDRARRTAIEKGLKIATLDECRQAISGCRLSDFHMAVGEYNHKTRYDGLPLILRNRDQIERFVEMAPAQIAPGHNPEGLSASVFDDLIKRHKRAVLDAYDLAGSVEAQRKGDESEQWLGRHGVRVVRPPSARPWFEGADIPGG